MSQESKALGELLAWWWQRLPNIEPHAASLLRELLTQIPSAHAASVGEGMVVVPREFVEQIRTLAHNYPMADASYTGYRGVECDAFREAYRRCGNDLKAALAMLATTPQVPK